MPCMPELCSGSAEVNSDMAYGTQSDLSTILRIAITGRTNTPDLCSIMAVLGRDECIKRIDDMISSL